MFLHQPTLVIPFTEVDYVEFERPENTVAGASVTRNFDFTVQLKSSGSAAGKRHSFTQIEKKEYKPLFDFLNTKKGSITIQNLQVGFRNFPPLKMELSRTLFEFIDYQIAKFRFTIQFFLKFRFDSDE